MKKTPWFLSAFLISTAAFGWGDMGHRTVGEIAQMRLNKKARKAIREIAGTESLAMASTWPDEMRSSPDQDYFSKTYPWHYMDLPNGVPLAGYQSPPQGDVLSASKKMAATLQDSKATPEKKLEALRFFVHFIGDLHQPLHVGNGTDQGGNWCMVQFFNEKTNLHSLWDSGLLKQLNLSFTETVRFLNEQFADEQKNFWASGKLEDWLDESRKIRDSIYPPSKDPANPHAYCKTKASDVIADEAQPKLSYDYAFATKPVLTQRLMQGGVRLAYWLNQILGGAQSASYKSDNSETTKTAKSPSRQGPAPASATAKEHTH